MTVKNGRMRSGSALASLQASCRTTNLFEYSLCMQIASNSTWTIHGRQFSNRREETDNTYESCAIFANNEEVLLSEPLQVTHWNEWKKIYQTN